MYRFAIVFLVYLMSIQTLAAENPAISELLAKFRQSLSWQESIAMKVTVNSEGEIDGERILGINERVFTFRRDHERAEWIGKKLQIDDNNKVDLDKCYVIKTIMNGDAFARLTSGLDRPPIGALISRDKEFYNSQLTKMLYDPTTGGPLWGRIWGSGQKNIADLLIESDNIHLHEKRENLNDTLCFVVESITRYGKVIAWIAPEKGYSALKWSIQKGPSDLFDDSPVNVNFWLTEFVADNLQKVSDFWVPNVSHLILRIEGDATKTNNIYKYKVSDIQIDPNFEAIDAFKIDFPDGTCVEIAETQGIRYIWQDGSVVDESGKVIMDCRPKKPDKKD